MSGPSNVTLISYLALYIYHASSHNGTWELGIRVQCIPNESKYTTSTRRHKTSSQNITYAMLLTIMVFMPKCSVNDENS